MPCGCLALPVELVRKLGDSFKSFFCDLHGEQKVTPRWLKDHKGLFGGKRVPTEFGYTIIAEE